MSIPFMLIQGLLMAFHCPGKRIFDHAKKIFKQLWHESEDMSQAYLPPLSCEFPTQTTAKPPH